MLLKNQTPRHPNKWVKYGPGPQVWSAFYPSVGTQVRILPMPHVGFTSFNRRTRYAHGCLFQGDHSHGKPGKVREFQSGQGKWKKSGEVKVFILGLLRPLIFFNRLNVQKKTG